MDFVDGNYRFEIQELTGPEFATKSKKNTKE